LATAGPEINSLQAGLFAGAGGKVNRTFTAPS
jgi:hypothetical protein